MIVEVIILENNPKKYKIFESCSTSGTYTYNFNTEKVSNKNPYIDATFVI